MRKVIRGKRLVIRPIEEGDLPYLIKWWDSGKVMKHVGFPRGLGITMEGLKKSWERWSADPLGLMKIIWLKDKTRIGETNFHDYDPKEKRTEIGLKICLPELWGQGLGTEALELMTDYAFEVLGVDRVLVNPSKTNLRIIHVNEKCGYRTIGEKDRGLLMELKRRDWLRNHNSSSLGGRE